MMNDDQIKHMVNRFLGWKLPENFSPDAGIIFKEAFNEHTAHPMKHEPSGTNLFDATQADAMVRYMVEGVADAPASDDGDLKFEPVNMGQALGVLADIVATYVSTVKTPAIEDQKKASQLSVTIFLHSLLMRAKHKEEMANLVDIIGAELREAAKAEPPADNSARPASSDS